jgi:hypothetical protein
MANSSIHRPVDALDAIFSQDQVLPDLVTMWRRATEQLSHEDDVDLRRRCGSAVKLRLQHLAGRETAREALVRG